MQKSELKMILPTAAVTDTQGTQMIDNEQKTRNEQLADVMLEIAADDQTEIGDLSRAVAQMARDIYQSTDFMVLQVAFLSISPQKLTEMNVSIIDNFIKTCAENSAQHVIDNFSILVTSSAFGLDPLQLARLGKSFKEGGFTKATERCVYRIKEVFVPVNNV